MVDRDVDRRARPGSCGDDDGVGGEGLLHAVDRQHFDQAIGKELGSTVEQGDAIARQLVPHILAMRCDDLVQAAHQRGDHDVRRDWSVQPSRGPCHPVCLQRALSKRFARNRSPVHTGAADTRLTLDHGHALACLRSLYGGLLAGGTASDHHNIIVLHGAHCAMVSTRLSTFSFRPSKASMSLG